jgi:hypothetical protein
MKRIVRPVIRISFHERGVKDVKQSLVQWETHNLLVCLVLRIWISVGNTVPLAVNLRHLFGTSCEMVWRLSSLLMRRRCGLDAVIRIIRSSKK